MARDAPPIAADLFLVGSGLFSSPHVSAVSKQINAAPYRFSATDSCRCHVEASLIVSSLRPSFPLLRRSPPIPSLPWLLAADLFRSRSAQVEALPCHSVASRCAWIPVPSLLRRLTGGRFQAVLFRFAAVAFHSFLLRCSSVGSAPRLSNSRQFTDLPLKAMASPCRSQLIPSEPFHLCPYRIVWPRRHSAAIRIVALPFHNHSHRLASIRCLRQSFRVAAMPLPVSSSPSAPFMAIPLLVASVRFLAVPSHIYWM